MTQSMASMAQSVTPVDLTVAALQESARHNEKNRGTTKRISINSIET